MSDPTRLVPDSASPPPVTGAAYMDAVAREVTGLWNRSVCVLTDVAGTANAITAQLVPALIGSPVDGMMFQLTPIANNTSAVTLSINGATPLAITDEFGQALVGNELTVGRRYLLLADGVGLRAYGVGASGSGGMVKRIYHGSTTWMKLDGLVKVIVMVRGAGGGGGHSASNTPGGGGGGGGEAIAEIMAGDLGESETVTVGNGGVPAAGGNPNTAGTGGSSAFGGHAVATGGEGGKGGIAEVSHAPGAAGVGTVGDLLLRGRPYAPRPAVAQDIGGAYYIRAFSIVGGGAPTGGDAPPQPTSGSTALAGPPGTGAGGMGGWSGPGAAGGTGLVVVEEYYR